MNMVSNERGLQCLHTRGGQKAKFGLRGGGLRMFLADAESNLSAERRRHFFGQHGCMLL